MKASVEERDREIPGIPTEVSCARIGSEPNGSALGSVLLESGNGAVPGTVSSFSYAEVHHRGNLIDCGRNFRLDKLGPRTKHHRCTRTKKSSEHSVGVKNAHHIGPYPATRVSPETPGDRSYFRVARLCRELVQGPKENTLRTLSRVEPQLCASWSQVNRIVQNTIGRSKKDAVPFLCQSLPVHIVSRSGPRLSGWNACTVLMNDHRPHGLDVVRNPEGVYGTELQLLFGCGRRVNKLEISTCTARWSKRSPQILDRRNLIGRRLLADDSESEQRRPGRARRRQASRQGLPSLS